MWRQRQVIRSLLALGEAVNQRIYVYHAAAFYREFLVDFKTQHFLNHILESVPQWLFRKFVTAAPRSPSTSPPPTSWRNSSICQPSPLST